MSDVKTKLVTMNVPVKDIIANGNVRTTTNKREDTELASNIDQYGVIEPIVLRKSGKQLIVIAGHRRLHAVRGLKGKTIPARILDISETEATKLQVIENLQRKDLTPMEEAEAYKLLLEQSTKDLVWDHKGKKVLPSGKFNAAVKLVAKSVDKKFEYVLRTLRLVELPKEVIGWIKKGKLTAMHGSLLIDLPEKALANVVEKFLTMQVDGLQDGDIFPTSLLKQYIDKTFARVLNAAPFPTDKEWAGTLACEACPSNSGNAMSLFKAGELGNCRETLCWNKKRDQVYRNIKAKTEERFKALKLKFSGYGRRIEADHSDRKGVLSKFIKGFLLLTDAQATELKELIRTKTALFGWMIIKPLIDSQKPQVDIVYVAKNLDILPAKFQKAAAKGIKEDGYDHERESFVRKRVSQAMNKAKVEGLKLLKPNTGYFLALAIGEYNNDRTTWKQAAKMLGYEFPKATKDTHVLEKMDIKKVATLTFAVTVLSEYDGAALLGIDTDKLTNEVTKGAVIEYAKAKSKEDTKK